MQPERQAAPAAAAACAGPSGQRIHFAAAFAAAAAAAAAASPAQLGGASLGVMGSEGAYSLLPASLAASTSRIAAAPAAGVGLSLSTAQWAGGRRGATDWACTPC